jgi:Ca2+-binding EF-hand superfamily protein
VSSGSSNAANLQKTFDRYKDASTGNIEFEGVRRFYDDLGVDAASDNITIMISSKMKADNMGVYTANEFKQGL